MKRQKIIRGAALLLAVMAVLTCCWPREAFALSDAEVDAVFRKRKTVGGMVVAARDGEIVYSRCYGYADKRAEEAVTPDTYFKLASVSKLVTGAAAMALAEEGKLDLDENIGHYLGNPPYEAASPRYPETGLTCRMLMTHTAAIRDNSEAYGKNAKLSQVLNPENNRMKTGFLKKKPGEAYKYSNYGAGMVGCLIEAVTGQRLTAAVKELLFDPLGIEAAYDPSLLSHPERIVTTYKASGRAHITRSYRLKQPYRAEPDPEQDYRDSYGGLWMRGEDLCRVGIMLCDMGAFGGQQVLSADTVREMLSSQQGKGNITADSPYGLNVERVKNLMDGKLVYGHQGLANGVLCSLYFDPETRFVFALVTNGCNVNAKRDRICMLSRDLFGLLWEEYAAK